VYSFRSSKPDRIWTCERQWRAGRSRPGRTASWPVPRSGSFVRSQCRGFRADARNQVQIPMGASRANTEKPGIRRAHCVFNPVLGELDRIWTCDRQWRAGRGRRARTACPPVRRSRIPVRSQCRGFRAKARNQVQIQVGA